MKILRCLRFVVSAIALCVFASGCGKGDLNELVKVEMQRELAKGDVLKALVIEDVNLVNKEGNAYIGTATGHVNGHLMKYDVTCTYDGKGLIWNATVNSDSDLTYLAKEKVKVEWEGLKETASQAIDSATVAASQAVEKVSAKTGELANRLKDAGVKAGEAARKALDTLSE